MAGIEVGYINSNTHFGRVRDNARDFLNDFYRLYQETNRPWGGYVGDLDLLPRPELAANIRKMKASKD